MAERGRVALITGAGSGIGRAAAVLLAKEGYRIGALGRDEDDLREVEREIRKSKGDAMVLVADVADARKMEEACRKLGEGYGRIDVVFANAGINGVWAPLDELEPEEWDKTLSINLKGTFLTVKYALPYLKRRGGSVIVTSSVNGTRIFSNTGATAYSCSKAGQVAFTQMVALELAKYRIRVNVICPGAITTNIEESTEKRDLEDEKEPVEFPEGSIPLTDGKPGTAEDCARLVRFLASDESRHITGTPIWIDGAQSLLQG
jgi:NAD(P)-dependent dehydrogenase (short-subunit alcohol dehydrogenase family)